MAFSLPADRHLLAWRSSSLLQQDSKPPNSKQHSLPQLRARHTYPDNGFYISSLIVRSKTVWPSQKREAPFSFCLKRNGGRLCFRMIAQAGRSKPKFSQPIRPRRVKRERPPSRQQPDPAGNIRRRTPADRQKPEPYVRHPDDYYKFGPYGPYDYKADVEAPMVPATSFEQDYMAMWSSIRDLNHQEQVDIENACINYHNRIRLFDESVGLQFFYVFVRLPYHVGWEPPWRQWTLVSEITVESGEDLNKDLDKDMLISRFDNSIRNRITKYTSWFRPDLIFVKPKRRGYQVRFEPEKDFLRELRSILMKSAGEQDEAKSYYGVFCKSLGVDVNASHEEIVAKYEGSPLEIQLACLEHLLSNHPVELLHHMPYPNRSVWTSKQSAANSNTTNSNEPFMQREVVVEAEGSNDADDENYLEGEEDEGEDGDEDEDEDEDEDKEDWDNLTEDEIRARLNKGFVELKDDEPARLDLNDLENDAAIDSDDEEFGGSQRNLHLSYMLKAAARPYTYVNFIREMVMLRESVLERKQQSRSSITALK